MTRYLVATGKGISPVIATVILVAVAITVSVSVAYWMGGISSLYTTIEKIEIMSITVNKGASNYTIVIDVKNTGSKDGVINAVLINQQLSTQYGSLITIDPLPLTVAAGGTGTLAIHIGTQSISPFTPQTTLDVKLHTAAGKDYPMMAALT